jgi:hypothetical protein
MRRIITVLSISGQCGSRYRNRRHSPASSPEILQPHHLPHWKSTGSLRVRCSPFHFAFISFAPDIISGTDRQTYRSWLSLDEQYTFSAEGYKTMPKVPKGRRKRAYRPKTRSGCLTCKGNQHINTHINVGRPKADSLDTVRRIKCDETRPACLRCTSTRRICDGYSSEPSTLSPTSLSSSPPENLLYQEVDKGLSLNIHPCDQSARSFNFFAQYTCHQLAGFFESPFWERLVLQTGQHEPAIRHALVAIGSLHMQQQDKRPSGRRDIEKIFALQQYNLAIRSLLALASRSPEGQGVSSRVPVDVCLISSILFACFENMQGHHKEAGCHITGGVKLLKETVYDSENGWLRKEVLGRQSSQNPYIPLETLASLFAGLSDEADMVS